VFLHLKAGAYHELNSIGGTVWDLVDGIRDITQIAPEIRERDLVR
jgi:hypothetical protein